MAPSGGIDGEIEKRFAEPDHASVRALLADCADDRLRLSILRLSRGKVERVGHWAQAARRDYRDVIAAASKPTRLYIAGLLRKGPSWSPEDENGRTHLNPEVLRGWKDRGAILVGGWFMDPGDCRGLYLFTVDSIEEAQALAREDETIRSGKLEFEFHPWLAPDGLKIASPEEL